MSTPKPGLLKEFKDFIVTGDLMSIAVAFIMAAIVKDLITSFIDNIFTGILGLVFGDRCAQDPDTGKTVCEAFSDMSWKTVNYGAFLNQVITFLATALVVFILIKAYRNLTGRGLASDGPSTNDLLTEIRDELRSGRQA
ncbi:MAG: large conductance mechanosensitive channel protein MscL [Actinomycetota bacterium]|jgi:large conductance mechanosensitive channel